MKPPRRTSLSTLHLSPALYVVRNRFSVLKVCELCEILAGGRTIENKRAR
ncbi:MAG: hypothetical protein ACTSSP_02205 [Candidatus Asgardarchaeia archaeon]